MGTAVRLRVCPRNDRTFAVAWLAGWLAVAFIPAEVLADSGVALAHLTTLSAALGVVLRAIGEEVFFRGLVGGILRRRIGFFWGNLVQSVVFIVPHLALLLIDARTWPVIPVQFLTGWLLGWLRDRSGSFLPGATIHAANNVAIGFLIH